MAELVEALGAPTRAERLDALGRVPGVWLPPRQQRHGPPRRRVARCSPDFARTMPVTRPVGPAARGGARPRRRRGHARLHRRVPLLPGRHVVPARPRATGRHGRRGGRLRARADRLRRGLARLAELVRLLGIDEAVERVRALRPGLRVSLPSLRIDSAAVQLARFGAAQRGSVDPRARRPAPRRLRDRINKGIDEAQVDSRPSRPSSAEASPGSSSTS